MALTQHPSQSRQAPCQVECDQVTVGNAGGMGPNQTLEACSLPHTSTSPVNTHQLSFTVTAVLSRELHPLSVESEAQSGSAT